VCATAFLTAVTDEADVYMYAVCLPRLQLAGLQGQLKDLASSIPGGSGTITVSPDVGHRLLDSARAIMHRLIDLLKQQHRCVEQL